MLRNPVVQSMFEEYELNLDKAIKSKPSSIRVRKVPIA